MNHSRRIPYLVSNYFRLYLPGECGFSSATISSYRDTFKQLFIFCKAAIGKEPEQMCLEDLNKSVILSFLDSLEAQGRSVSTRNQRLAAIKSFFQYAKYEVPDCLDVIKDVLEIRVKKSPKTAINYLSPEGIASILWLPDMHTRSGFRDALMLTLLYDTAARVTEVTEIRVGDIRLSSPATLVLHGKGQKDRIVPVAEKTAELIRSYVQQFGLTGANNLDKYLFTNRSGIKLTRAGVAYVLKKYVDMAREKQPELIPDKFSPHCMRHSKAMHLLQAGVAIIYIRDFLGHCSIKTTEIYAKCDEKAKRDALESAYNSAVIPEKGNAELWNDDESLMTFLTNLCK